MSSADPHAPLEGRTERESGPRTVVVLGLSAVLLAALAGVGIVAAREFGADEAEAPATTLAAEPELAEAEVADSPTKLFDRVTDAGVSLRVFRSDDVPQWGPWNAPGFEDERPESCRQVGTVQATAIGDAAVVTSQTPLSADPGDTGNVSFGVGGLIEDEPLLVFTVQVPTGTVAVGASAAGGGRDSMEPVDGVAALVIDAPEALAEMWSGMAVQPAADPWQGIVLEFRTGSGDTTRLTGTELNSGMLMSFNDPACWEQPPVDPDAPVVTIPPPTLPPGNGELPEDPDAAATAIRAALDAVYAPGPRRDAARVAAIDDPSGVQFMLDRVRDDPNGREIEPDHLELVEVGFLSAVEASFFYELRDDSVMDFGQQYGRARFIDGAWKITRATFCHDYERIGAGCGP